MLGFLGIFGRAGSLKVIDQTLRSFDVHPRLVPEAVKLTAIKLVQDAPRGASKPGPAPPRRR